MIIEKFPILSNALLPYIIILNFTSNIYILSKITINKIYLKIKSNFFKNDRI